MADSFWPMIAGETGLIGLVSIIAVLYLMLKRIQQIRQSDSALYVGGLMILVYLLIVSMAESAFINPVAIPLALLPRNDLWENRATSRKSV